MNKKKLEDLMELAKILRGENGCPWDKEQTIASMLKCIDDEVMEVRMAIENGDHENLKEELGDVLFQLVMIAQIASEQKYFNMDDVVKGIHEKIVSRHTWVFGEHKVSSAEEAIKQWKENKSKENKRK
jgi:tetrapyrrole methylase family protein / MazG family protein